MKKFSMALMLLFIVPMFVLAGCGGSSLLQKTSTTKTPLGFISSVSSTINGFKDLTESDDYNTNDLKYSGADYDNYETCWDIIQSTNKQLLFALTAYDMYEMQKDRGFYDLSCLGGAEEDNLNNFNLVKDTVNSTDSQLIYLYKLSGNEASDFLPSPTPNMEHYIDTLDLGTFDGVDISTWGNWIRFTVKLANTNTITIEPVFIFPTAEEVPEVEDTERGLKIVREGEKSRITVVYNVGGVTYSKRVSFITDEIEKTTTKQVDYFVGDILEAGSSAGDELAPKSYFYELKSTSEELFLCGKYEISFDRANSNLYCKTPGYNDSKRVSIEIFKMHTGEIITRYIKPLEGVQLQQVDFILYPDLISGSIKTERATTISFTRIGVDDGYMFDHTYGMVTEADRNSVNPIREFLMKNGTIEVKRVN